MVTLGHVIPTHKKKTFERVIAPFYFVTKRWNFATNKTLAGIGMVKKSPIDRVPERAGVFNIKEFF
jgi:hypothetical protein